MMMLEGYMLLLIVDNDNSKWWLFWWGEQQWWRFCRSNDVDGLTDGPEEEVLDAVADEDDQDGEWDGVPEVTANNRRTHHFSSLFTVGLAVDFDNSNDNARCYIC